MFRCIFFKYKVEEKLAAKEKPLNGDRFSETRLGGAIPRRSLKYSVTAAAAAAKCAKKTSFLLVQVGVPACTIYLFYILCSSKAAARILLKQAVKVKFCILSTRTK